jgi:hypothetical protein
MTTRTSGEILDDISEVSKRIIELVDVLRTVAARLTEGADDTNDLATSNQIEVEIVRLDGLRMELGNFL